MNKYALIVLLILGFAIHAEDLSLFLPKRTKPATESISQMKDRSDAALSRAQDCTYDVTKTYVAAFQKDSYCNGAKLNFCFATMNCKAIGAVKVVTCVASADGKCPADPMECQANANKFHATSKGVDAIASKPPAAVSLPDTAQ